MITLILSVVLLGQIKVEDLPFAEKNEYVDAVDNLKSNYYQDRMKAMDLLSRAKERAIPILMFYKDKYPNDAEARLRIQMLLKNYCDKYIVPSDNESTPWIDCLPIHYPERQDVIQKYQTYYYVSEDYTNDYPIYREHTRKLVFDLFMSGKNQKELIEMLDKMVKNEKEWGWRPYKAQPDFAN